MSGASMRLLVVCASLSLLAPSAQAQASAEIVIGQTAGFTGVVAAGVKETHEGAKLCFDAVNAKGGIHGKRISLVSLDDQFEPKNTAALARTLITEHRAIALFMTRGTPNSQSLLPVLKEYGIVLVAPSTGAMVLHQPVHPWVFNVRAPYWRESERAVMHLTSSGIERIAVVRADDSFGEDVAAGADKGFQAARRKPVFVDKFNRTKPDFSQLGAQVIKADAQAVLFIGSGQVVADGVAVLRKAGSRAQVVTFSNNASGGFIKSLGDNAYGVIVAQVFPNERRFAAPIVKEAHTLAVAKGLPGLSPAMLEGYAGAKVLVEGLRRAGPNATRKGLRDALEGMNRVDLGGMELSYSPDDHTGLEYVDLSIIGQNRTFQR